MHQPLRAGGGDSVAAHPGVKKAGGSGGRHAPQNKNCATPEQKGLGRGTPPRTKWQVAASDRPYRPTPPLPLQLLPLSTPSRGFRNS